MTLTRYDFQHGFLEPHNMGHWVQHCEAQAEIDRLIQVNKDYNDFYRNQNAENGALTQRIEKLRGALQKVAAGGFLNPMVGLQERFNWAQRAIKADNEAAKL